MFEEFVVPAFHSGNNAHSASNNDSAVLFPNAVSVNFNSPKSSLRFSISPRQNCRWSHCMKPNTACAQSMVFGNFHPCARHIPDPIAIWAGEGAIRLAHQELVIIRMVLCQSVRWNCCRHLSIPLPICLQYLKCINSSCNGSWRVTLLIFQ